MRNLSPSLKEAQEQTGDVKGALKTASAVQNSSTRAYALRRVAAAQAEAEDVKGALSWSENQVSPLQKSQALLGVAEGILAGKEIKELGWQAWARRVLQTRLGDNWGTSGRSDR